MLDTKILRELHEYILEHTNNQVESNYFEEAFKIEKEVLKDIHSNELEHFVNQHKKETFQQVLFDYIDRKASSDSEIYKKAGIDRRHFSKIRSNPNYKIGKNTVIALALALELTTEETDKLLGAAGYALSESDTFDLIIQFCLTKKIYKLHDVNQALDYFSLKPIG